MAKKCPPGKYYCFDDKKCKKIPRGYHIGARGYLARDDDNETKKNGNGNSNGNGNGGNGAGNGNGGSGGGANGNGGGMGEEVIYEILDKKDVPHVKKLVKKLRAGSKTHAKQADDLEVAMKEGMYNHPEFALITVAVDELEKGLMELEGITHDSVDKLMQGIAKRNNISPTLLHNQFKSKHLTIPDDWAIRQRMNRMKESVEDILATPVFSSKKSKNMSSIKKITSVPVKKAKVVEAKMTEKEMEKREDIVKGMKKNKSGFKKRYGKDAKSVMYATATKLAMKEESQEEMLARVRAAQDKLQTKKEIKDKVKKQVTPRIHPQKGEIIDDGYKYNVSEEGLRDWFGKSSGTTKSGRKVKGWVQVGGKYDGKPCARQPGQKSTPKCVSSSKRASMSDKERDSAARRKRAADPNQPQKSGAAKPTNVSTDPKRKMKENYFNRNKVVEGFKGYADLSHMQTPKQKKEAEERLKKFTANTYREQKKKEKKDTKESFVNEAKDKKGKGSGTKDACYHKVKSRYSVWPSAYASGALVKCRKVGAANWGNKSKNEGFSPMQVAALEAAGMIEIKEGQKCWKGYEKKGTKKMFGKTYNNCVKKEEVEFQEGSYEDFEKKSGVKAVKPKKEVELPKTPEKKPENTYSSGNPVGKKNVRKMIDVTNRRTSDDVSKRDLVGKIRHVVLGDEYAPVTEGVSFLKRKKEERKPKKAMDAGARLRRKKQRQEYAAKISGSEDNVPDDIRDHVELAAESKTRLVKNGHTYKVILTWRGKTYMVQMFVPSVSRPTRLQIEKEVQKLYPDAKVMSFLPRDLEPGEPTVMMGEGKNLDFMKQYKQKENEEKQKAKVKKNLETYEGDEQHNTRMGEAIEPEGMKLRDVERIKRQKQLSDAAKKAPEVKNKIVPIKTSTMEEYISELSPGTLGNYIGKAQHEIRVGKVGDASTNFRRKKLPLDLKNKREGGVDLAVDKLVKKAEQNEEYVTEDDMKGMSVKSGHKRPTKAGAGMTKKGVEAYRRKNPGSKLQTAVTGKVKKGSKDAKRRKSYCARSAGQMKKFPKAAKDPNSRLRQARKRWKC